MHTREQLIQQLKQSTLEVTFTKVNGEQRVMPCTLRADIVPPVPAPKILSEGEVAKVKKSNPDVVNAWCTDKNEWRSFRVDSVTNVTDLG